MRRYQPYLLETPKIGKKRAKCKLLKYKASEEFLHVQLLTRGSRLRLLRRLRLLENPQIVKIRAKFKLVNVQSFRRAYYFFSFSQRGPCLTVEAVASGALLAIPT